MKKYVRPEIIVHSINPKSYMINASGREEVKSIPRIWEEDDKKEGLIWE